MSVFVNNLDDFIIPSQACVNPLVASKREEALKEEQNRIATSSSSSSKPGVAKISLQSDFSVSEYDIEVEPNLIKTTGGAGAANKKVATVSLNDCLACSGCVTSAESVLIQEQSYCKLLEALTVPGLCVVVTLSPQTIASLAAFVDAPSVLDTFLRVATYLKSLGVRYVIDAAAGGDVVLLEAREEFLRRHEASTGVRNPSWDPPPTSSPHSSTHYLPAGEVLPQPIPAGGLSSVSAITPHPLPVIASHCPGFICYAEKTTPQILPYVSTVKSAQQVIGTVLKCVLPQQQRGGCCGLDGLLPADPQHIYHVSVQPCFDKKLEGSRQDFFHEALQVAEVDLVLSTTELWRLLEDSYRGREQLQQEHQKPEGEATEPDGSVESAQLIDYLNSFALDAQSGRDAVEGVFRVFSDCGQRLVNAVDANAGSGGFAEYIFKHCAERLYGQDLWSVPLQYTQGRNADTAEVTLTDPQDGRVLLTFSRMYGFRNIQSLVLKMKRKRFTVDYVELMACPSGCANGGGQIKTKVSEHPSEIAQRVEKTQAYLHSPLVVGRVEDSALIKFLYGDCSKRDGGTNTGSGTSFRSINLFQTTYHAIPKLEVIAPLAARW